MTPPRQEFFANDVIFLGDMPPTAHAGPERSLLRAGQGVRGQLRRRAGDPERSPLRSATIGQDAAGRVAAGHGRSGGAAPRPGAVQPATYARRRRDYAFMQLGDGSSLPEMQKAWDNLGPLPWYQPVEGIQASATVLAEHPTATLRRRQEAAPDRHPPVRPRRGRLPGLQRDLAAAAGPWRRALPPVLERGHVAAGAEPRPGRRTSASSSRPIGSDTRSIRP